MTFLTALRANTTGVTTTIIRLNVNRTRGSRMTGDSSGGEVGAFIVQPWRIPRRQFQYSLNPTPTSRPSLSKNASRQ
jgi:hypothetical protein